MAKTKKGVVVENVNDQVTKGNTIVTLPPGKYTADELQAKVAELADEQAMLGRMTPRERAMLAFGLEEAHVLKAAVYEKPEGVEVVILTQGGQRLRWPADAGRVLAQHEKDGTVPGAPAGGIFPAKT